MNLSIDTLTGKPDRAQMEVTVTPEAALPTEMVQKTQVFDLAKKEQSEEAKQEAEELLRRVNEAGETLRALIVAGKKVQRLPGLEAHQHQTRSLDLAQENLQVGLMWLRRAIEQPKVF